LARLTNEELAQVCGEERERLEVGDFEAKIIYTLPLLPDSSSTEAVGVLPFIQNGSAYRI